MQGVKVKSWSGSVTAICSPYFPSLKRLEQKCVNLEYIDYCSCDRQTKQTKKTCCMNRDFNIMKCLTQPGQGVSLWQ